MSDESNYTLVCDRDKACGTFEACRDVTTVVVVTP